YLFFLLTPPPPSSTPFPSTTLFRSGLAARAPARHQRVPALAPHQQNAVHRAQHPRKLRRARNHHRPDENLEAPAGASLRSRDQADRKSTRLNSSHQIISYAVFCLKK